MSTSKDRMQAYALRGVRDEIGELTERVAQLQQDFPSVSAFGVVKLALVDTAKEVGRLAGVHDDDDDDDDDDDGPTSKPKPNGRLKPQQSKQSKQSKPKPKQGKSTRGMSEHVARDSWLKGREVLELLEGKPDGMRPVEVSTRLGLSYGAAYWRLKKREQVGHCTLDESTMTFFITSAGKAALAKDQDAAEGAR